MIISCQHWPSHANQPNSIYYYNLIESSLILCHICWEEKVQSNMINWRNFIFIPQRLICWVLTISQILPFWVKEHYCYSNRTATISPVAPKFDFEIFSHRSFQVVWYQNVDWCYFWTIRLLLVWPWIPYNDSSCLQLQDNSRGHATLVTLSLLQVRTFHVDPYISSLNFSPDSKGEMGQGGCTQGSHHSDSTLQAEYG